MLPKQLKLWECPELSEINRLPMGSTSTPCASVEELSSGSSRVLSLDGNWDFLLLGRPEEVEDAHISGSDTINWSKMPVPANWTMHSKDDLPHYTNVRLPDPVEFELSPKLFY